MIEELVTEASIKEELITKKEEELKKIKQQFQFERELVSTISAREEELKNKLKINQLRLEHKTQNLREEIEKQKKITNE
jgi:hypothetical protein